MNMVGSGYPQGMDRPTLQQLAYAVAVADEGHFGRAAAACAVSQPGLSAQIKALEQRLGVALFERDRRQVLITDAGRALVEHARRILQLTDDLVAEAERLQGEFTGTVTLGVIPTAAPYVLLQTIDAFRSLHPQGELDFQELPTEHLLQALRRGDIDVGLLALPFDEAGIETAPVGIDEFMLAFSEQHELAQEPDAPVRFSELSTLPLLLLEDGHCLRDQALEVCRMARVNNDGVTVQGATLTTLCRLVAANVGVTLLPATAVRVEARPGSGLLVRPFAEPRPRRELVLAWRDRSPFARDFARLAEFLVL